MAIKTKLNEFIGNIVSKKDLSGVLTEIEPVSPSTKATYKIAEDAKLGLTPSITVAQSILQKTGFKDNVKNYSDSLNSLLTNYLANNLSIPNTKSGKLESALEVSVEEKSHGTTIYIKNDGKETSIYVSENGSLIEATQNISNERYGQYVLSSTSKEQPIEENLLIELHDDGNMNVLTQQTTVQKTESLKNPDGTPTGEHICSVKSNATAYIQRADGEKLFIPSPEVASCEINYKENATAESIASRFDTVYNVIDTHKGIAGNSFENIERIYYLQEYKGYLPVENNNYVSLIQNSILTDRSVENSRYNCTYSKEYPTITSSSVEEMNAKAISLNQRAKQLYREYASDPKEVLKHKQDNPCHYTLKPEAIEELKNGVHSDEVMRALISDPTKQALDKSKEFFSTLAKGYEGTDPNVVVTLFDGKYSSFIATINAEGKDSTVLNVGPKQYSYTIMLDKDKYGKDELKHGKSYTTQEIKMTNLNINKEDSFGTVCKPAVNTICCNYTVTEVKDIPEGSISSLQVGLPASVKHTGYKEVGTYRDLSNIYYQFPNAPYSCFTDTEETVFNQETGEVSSIKTEEYTDENGQFFAGEPKTTKIEGVEIKPTQPGEFVVSKVQDTTQDDGINQ